MVTAAILLDAGPLGLVTNPRMSAQSVECLRWIQASLLEGVRILVPEIADYEVRRELLRAERTASIRRLDLLTREVEYVPITTAVMRLAAQLWAQARQQGRPTADNRALDGDVILAAQALTCGYPDAVVATTNVAHLERYVRASLWTDLYANLRRRS